MYIYIHIYIYVCMYTDQYFCMEQNVGQLERRTDSQENRNEDVEKN